MSVVLISMIRTHVAEKSHPSPEILSRGGHVHEYCPACENKRSPKHACIEREYEPNLHQNKD